MALMGVVRARDQLSVVPSARGDIEPSEEAASPPPPEPPAKLSTPIIHRPEFQIPIGGTPLNPFGPRSIETLAHILNTEDHSSESYQRAVAEWPEDTSIWDHLDTRETREQFVYFILAQDDTDQREYESFDNYCTGFATQMSARYSSNVPLSEEAQDRLSLAGIDMGDIPEKLRFPLSGAANANHFFNAVLVGDDPFDFSHYLFFEPQSDFIIQPESATYWEYISERGMTLSELADFNEDQQYIFTSQRYFTMNGQQDMVEVTDYAVFRFTQDFMVALSSETNYEHQLGDISFP